MSSMTLAPTIHEAVCGEREGFISLTRDLVLLESPSQTVSQQRRVLERIGQELIPLGYRLRYIRGISHGEQLLAVPIGARSPYQLCVGHADTVWPLGTLSTMPVTVDQERMTGPGIFDMKAGLAQLVIALRTIASLGLTPAVAPLVFINSDEELSSPDSTRALRRLARISRRVWVLEPAYGPTGKLKTARKGVGRFEIRITGRAAHAGLNPEDGISAIAALSQLVLQVFALNDPTRRITINVGQIDGGMQPNVVAPTSRAVIDARVPDQETAHEIETALFALARQRHDVQIQVSGGFSRPPMTQTPNNQVLWRLARFLGRTIGLELEEAAVGGASDGNTTSGFAPTLDGLGAVGGGAHATNEHILIDRSLERAALLALLLLAPTIPWDELDEG